METNNLPENKFSKRKLNEKIKDLKSSYILTYKSLSLEKINAFWVFVLLGFIFIIFGIEKVSESFLITIPTYGGTLNEGIIGTPRYINPVLANSEGDKDLTTLIYSGLLKKDKDGNLVNDLANNIEESDDHLNFTVDISPEAKFQDGVKVTADDVVFTLSKIQNKNIDSPIEINFEGVDIEKVNDRQVIFHLKKPYIYFKENLTFGILPKHIWENISDDEFPLSINNTNPIGSGPYKIKKVLRNSNNLPTEYDLEENNNYIAGRPYIDNINIYIYQNNDDLVSALNNGDIDATNYLDTNYFSKINNKDKKIISSTLTNIFSISFNPSKNSSLVNANTRNALRLAINKQEIIDQVFGGYATRIDSLFTNNQNNSAYDINNAKSLLNKTITTVTGKGKNKKVETKIISQNNIQIDLATADIENLKKVANKISEYWQNLGATVNIKIYSLSDIMDVIKKRDFDALLFGAIMNRDTDLYAYLHSSQRIYPGLNITGYASKNLDKNLEILKNSLDQISRQKAIDSINKELEDESPFVSIYSNNSNYLINRDDLNVEDFIPKSMQDGNDRFINVRDWYIYKEKVWKFSYKKSLIEKLQNIIH